jgi:hypothetical protein
MSKLLFLVVLVIIVMMLWGSIAALGKKLFGDKAAPPKPTPTTVHYSDISSGMNIVPGKNVIGLPVGAFTGCFTAPGGWHITEEHDRRFDGTVKVEKKKEARRIRSRLDIRGNYAKDEPKEVQEPIRILEIRGDCAKDGVGYLSTSFTPGYKLKSFSAKNNGMQPAAITVWLRPI